MKYVAMIGKTGNGYAADLPDLPGCVAAGDTFEETSQLIREAAKYHLELMAEHGESIPEPLNAAIEVEVQLPVQLAREGWPSQEETEETKQILDQPTEGIANPPIEQWRLYPAKVTQRWYNELSHLEMFTHYASSIGRIYSDSALRSLGPAPQERVVNPKEQARNLIVALIDLHAKSCSLAGAILPVLRYGYPNAGWILCRTMLENLIVMRFLDEYNEQDAAERYNGSISIQFADGSSPSDAKELYDEFASYFPDAKEHGWASGIGRQTRWNTRDMAKAVGAEDLYTSIFKSESKFTHPDASGFYGDIDDPVVPAFMQARAEPNPSRLYGQTDGVSLVLVAFEVAQYLEAATLTLIRAHPIEKGDYLESEFSTRCKTVIDLLSDACRQSLFLQDIFENSKEQ